MIHRLFRMVASFAAVLAVYWLYALIAVPIIEPSVQARSRIELTPSELAEAQKAGKRNTAAFAKFFKPGDWELEGNPKVLESSQAKLLVQEYKTFDDGRVKLQPCTLIFFLDADKDVPPDQEQAIVMRAPEAILKFDEAFDLKRAKVGKLIGGSLNGRITIASAPTKPGSAEDLLIVTQDVELRDDRVWTPHPVQFRMGKNRGSGRDMRINLMKSDTATGKGLGAQFGSVDSFELVRDVKLHIELEPGTDEGGLFGQRNAKKATDGTANRPAEPQPPVEVTCQGPFKFDFARSLATFTDQVDVLRINPQGPSDQLNCELLAIQFGPRERSATKRRGTEKTGERGASKASEDKPGQFDLEPRRLEAVGDPVVIRAPSQGGHARCQRLEYEVKTGRIVLEGSENIMLHHGLNEIHAPRLDYRPGENGRLGWLEVAGPGWMQGAVEDDPRQKYQAQWSKEIRMRPQDQLQVVSIVGGAEVRFTEMGTLSADEIHLWLLETEKQPKTGQNFREVVTVNYAPGSIQSTPSVPQRLPDTASESLSAAGKPKRERELDIIPDRMMAQGNVRVDGPQLTGGTQRLEVWFQQAAAEAPSADSSVRGRGSRRLGQKPSQSFDVRGELIRLQLSMDKRETRLNDVSIEGAARLIETRTKKPDEQPLVVQGDRLQVAQADSDEALVNVSGKPAMVEARGLALVGAKINLDRATNRLWIDGPGRMRLPMERDFNGQALEKVQQVEIDWQGGMQFNGKTVIYDRTVRARGEHQTLATETLEVTLRERIDFNNPELPNQPRTGARGPQGEAADVEQISCRGGVTIHNKSFDNAGEQASLDRMQMRDITINMENGKIAGAGPGWITTVRRGGPMMPVGTGAPLGGLLTGAGQGSEEMKYSFLNVRFEGPIGGNVHRRELTFSDQVRSVFGPVKDWQSELDPDSPDALGPQAILLNCDQLVVRQMPPLPGSKDTTAELEAIGNTLVEGQDFTARAHRLSYAQAKELLILEGNASTDAQLYRQAQPGGATSQLAAGRIMYWLATKRVEVKDARFLDVGNLPAGKPGSTSNGGFPNLFPNTDTKQPATGPGARRTPSGNGTALPSIRR